MYDIATLKEKKLPELQDLAKNLGLKRITGLKKIDLIYKIIDHIAANPPAKRKIRNRRKKEKKQRVEKIQPKADEKKGGQKEKNQPQDQRPKEQGNGQKHHHQQGQNKHKHNKQNRHQNKHDGNHNKDHRNRYREPDYEFDGIIDTEGVLEIMPEGYVFCGHQTITTSPPLTMFMFLNLKYACLD